MIDCLELLDEIIEIYPVPAGLVTFPVPFQVRQITVSPTVSDDEEHPVVSLGWLRSQPGMVVESVYPDNSHARTIIIEDKATVKGTPKTSVAGRYYQMSVSAKSHQQVEDVQYMADYALGADYFDVFIVDASENIYVLRGVYPATNIEVATQLPLYKDHDISITVECVSGLQRIV